MINTLINYLKEKYYPVEAILLHGSRASGYAKEHSDWDFIVLTHQKINQIQYRDEINGENIEFEVFTLPMEKDEVLNKFGTKLKHVKVVYDVKNKGEQVLKMAKNIYSEGLPEIRYSLPKRIATKAHLNSAISGMKDNIDNPAMFTKKFGVFYPRIINVWFQFVNKTYSDNLYIALPLIKEKDIIFYELLEVLYSYDTKPSERISIAEKLVKHIFI